MAGPPAFTVEHRRTPDEFDDFADLDTPEERRTEAPLMTAPSLILVGYGSRDPRVAQVSHDIRAGVLAIRPELDVHIAFVGEGQPNGLQVAAKLAKRGVEEAVIVPLLLSDAFNAHAEFPALVAQIARPPRD